MEGMDEVMEADEKMITHDKQEGIFAGWHLDKRVSVAHFFATFAFFFGLASWQWAEHERVSLIERDMMSYIKLDAAEMSHMDEQMGDIKTMQSKAISMMNTQYSEILIRLAAIDASINRHLENHNK